IRPPGPKWLIEISLYTSGNPKLILRTDTENFEFLRGTPTRELDESLHDLDRSCRLPPNPIDAVGLVKIKWERQKLSQSEWAKTHDELLDALLNYTADLRENHRKLLATKSTYLQVHAAQYSVIYDAGTYYVKARADDTIEEPALIRWAKSLGERS